MKIIMVLLRIVVCPFMMCCALPRFMLTYFIFIYNFLRYGGETKSYLREDKKTISDIYELLKKEYEVKKAIEKL